MSLPIATSAELAIPAELASLNTAELREEWDRCLVVAADNLVKMAQIARLFKERGEEPPRAAAELFQYLLRIAYGQILAEVVARFMQSPQLLRKVAALPMPDQVAIIEGRPVLLVVPRDGDTFTTRMADPSKMLPEQVRQVFGPDGIRDEAQQILEIERDREKVRASGVETVGRITVDLARGGFRVGRVFIPEADVAEALALYRSAERPPNRHQKRRSRIAEPIAPFRT